MIEFTYQREVEYPIDRVVSQYFDLEHLEHVHPRTFGRAHLISQHQDTVIWDLEWPPILGCLRLRNRVVQRFLPPNRIHARLSKGFLRDMNVEVEFSQTPCGTMVKERYKIPLPNWSLLRVALEKSWSRRLDKIWEEDLRVGVCHGGWPGVPQTGRAEFQ